MKRITLITGHYGSGKTNFAVNLALQQAAAGKKVTVVDLDIVNPYFRTADFADLFAENGSLKRRFMPIPVWIFQRFLSILLVWHMRRIA